MVSQQRRQVLRRPWSAALLPSMAVFCGSIFGSAPLSSVASAWTATIATTSRPTLPSFGLFLRARAVPPVHQSLSSSHYSCKQYASQNKGVHTRLSLSSSDDNNDLHRADEPAGIGVGIDLGTTHSAVAFLDPATGLPTIIPIPANGRTMPSVVAFATDEDDDCDNIKVLVGRPAVDHEANHGAYRNVKRILGRGKQAAYESRHVVPFSVAAERSSSGATKGKKKSTTKLGLAKQLQEAQEDPALLLGPSPGQLLHPEEISAHILRTLVQTAEEYTGQRVTRAVIGVPAYFHDAQREATLKAAKLAGLEKVKLLREPEAAALAYGVGRKEAQQQLRNDKKYEDDDDDDDDELVLVFDLGGGTYDVSMLLVGGGLTEIITTSGNSQLGGSDMDAKISQHLQRLLKDHGQALSPPKDKTEMPLALDAMVRSAEMIRIYLSNNKRANLALPLDVSSWRHMGHGTDVILPLDFTYNDQALPNNGVTNSTHVLCQLTRREMERMCHDEFLALLRPLREVAIMAGALLPGDTSPTIVEAALEMEEQDENALTFGDFYPDADSKAGSGEDTSDMDAPTILQLQANVEEHSLKAQKRAQQRGRKKARDVTKRERTFRQEKRKLKEQLPPAEVNDIKVRDGISGRPISRVVLVGGATRMPAIGRLLSAVTGIVPQKTVNPDEAVALGCAVHVGVLDGREDLGTVLTPMQAAILRAVAEQRQNQGVLISEDESDDEDKFDTVEYF